MQRTKLVETIIGKGRLTGQDAPVDYNISVFQNFDGDVALLKSARGRINLPNVEAVFDTMGRHPMELELQDGRKAKFLLIDINGNIQVTGPIA